MSPNAARSASRSRAPTILSAIGTLNMALGPYSSFRNQKRCCEKESGIRRGRTTAAGALRARSASSSGRGIFTHPQHELAEILPGEQLQERVRKGLDPVHDVFVGFQSAALCPFGQLENRAVVTGLVVEHHESLHAGAIDQQRHVVSRPLGRGRVVDLRNGAADDDAGARAKTCEHCVEGLAADIIEIDVDTVGTMPGETGKYRTAPIIDTRIETQLFGNVGTFALPTRNADHTAAD